MIKAVYNRTKEISSMMSDLDRIKDDLKEYKKDYYSGFGFSSYLEEEIRNELIDLINSYVTRKQKALEKEIEEM